MAQLKDLIVNGASQLIGDVYTSQIQISKLNAPTSANGATYGAGSSGQALLSDGTTVYWGDISTTDTKQNIVLATTSKAYLTGVTTAPTSTAQALTAVADTGVYLTTTAGQLAANSIMIVGSANSTNTIASDATNNIYAKVNNKISLVVTDTAIRSATSLNGQIDLGTSAIPWNNVYANYFYGDGSNLTNLPVPTITFKDWTVN